MAVETDGPRPAAGVRVALEQGISRLGDRARGVGGSGGTVSNLARTLGSWLRLPGHYLRLFARRIGLYEFMTYGPLIRFLTRNLRRRIIFANLIGLAILLLGMVYLNQRPSWLIEAKRESLRAQGEVFAAAIAGGASIERGGRLQLDPDKLPDSDGTKSPFEDPFTDLQLSIRPDRVAPIVQRLVHGTGTRARIYGQNGTLIIDTDELLTRKMLRGDAVPADDQPLGRAKIKNAWTRFLSWLSRGNLPIYREIGTANGMTYPEVGMALKGGTPTPMLLVNERGEQIVSVAAPIQYRKAVQGVLLLSTRPGEIDEILSEERFFILIVGMLALGATVIASLLLARTIAGPMRRLSATAENVTRHINARHELPELTHRADEVGQMASAFREMTASLYKRIEASERFAQDVAHELKNPLTAARSTAEALAYAKTPEKQQELVRQIQEELKRLNKLISDVANASRLDAELALQATEPVDVRQALVGIVDVFRDGLISDSRTLALEIEDAPFNPQAYVVLGHEARLGRVFTNLLDNALSFSPESGVVMVRARRIGPEIEIVVDDEGPGIPPDKLEDVFTRFYSDRPHTDGTIGKNSGLGLSISREIVNAYGGRIWAENRVAENGDAAAKDAHAALKERRAPGVAGSRFTVRLPAADAAPAKGAQALGRRS